jgi:hypothetical protein
MVVIKITNYSFIIIFVCKELKGVFVNWYGPFYLVRTSPQ